MKNENWKQELVDFINEKAQEYKDVPRNAYGYFNLMAQLARHEMLSLLDQWEEPEDKCITCDTPIAGAWGYCTPCFNEEADAYINKKLQETNDE